MRCLLRWGKWSSTDDPLLHASPLLRFLHRGAWRALQVRSSLGLQPDMQSFTFLTSLSLKMKSLH